MSIISNYYFEQSTVFLHNLLEAFFLFLLIIHFTKIIILSINLILFFLNLFIFILFILVIIKHNSNYQFQSMLLKFDIFHHQ
jgi:hypothetical protein